MGLSSGTKGRRRVWVLKGRRAPERRYHCILMWSTKAHLHSVTSGISIPMEEENHICDANSAGVLARHGRYNVSLGIPHTRLIRAGMGGGALADSNLALCDPQIRDGEEVLECVCLAVGDFHFSIGGGATAGWDSMNVTKEPVSNGAPSSFLPPQARLAFQR